MKYLEQLPETITHVVLVSDSCGGQNRNINVLTSLLVAVQILNIQRIDHVFLERGHTQMDCDTVHSLVERTIRNEKGNLGIRGPSDLIRLIKLAAKTHPIEVHPIMNREIINWKRIANDIVTNRKYHANGQPLMFTKAKMFRFEKSKPGEVLVLYRIDRCHQMMPLFVTERTDAARKKKGPRVRYAFPTVKQINELLALNLYSNKLPISKAKYDDLQTICKSGFVPPPFHRFYSSLPTKDTAESESDKEDCYSSTGSEIDTTSSQNSESSSEEENSSCSSSSDDDDEYEEHEN